MTVRVDSTLGRAVLGDAELAVGCLLAVEPDHESLAGPGAREARAALEAGGALSEGRPVAWLAGLLEVVARPALRATVEMHSDGQLAVTAAAWGAGERTVLGLLADGGTELSALEALHLPWVLAREVGLGPRPEPVLEEPLILTVAAIEAAERALGAGREDEALAALGGVGRAETVLALLRDRRSSWRVTVGFASEDGETTRSTAALDAGSHGLFLTEAIDLDGAPAVGLHPAGSEDAVDALLGLFDAL